MNDVFQLVDSDNEDDAFLEYLQNINQNFSFNDLISDKDFSEIMNFNVQKSPGELLLMSLKFAIANKANIYRSKKYNAFS